MNIANTVGDVPGLIYGSEMAGVTQLDSCGSSGGYTRKFLKDLVSPFKLTLLMVIDKHYGMMMSPDPVYNDSEECDMMIILLELVLGPDLTLIQLVERFKTIASSELMSSVLERLGRMFDGGLHMLYELLHDIQERMLTNNEVGHFSAPAMSKSSVIGKFIRSVCIAFEKLEFSLVTKLFNRFEAEFREASKQIRVTELYDDDHPTFDSSQYLIEILPTDISLAPGSEGTSREGTTEPGRYSQRQAEFFIAEQAQLLNNTQQEALGSVELEKRIKDLLRLNPDLAEAHFLSYMNHLRVKEYCGAIDSLFHYFDRCHIAAGSHTGAGNKTNRSTDEESHLRGYRYAALNLAALQYRYGHRIEAIAALREAIRMAQQSNDSVCLQHALGWLQRLGLQDGGGSEFMLERLITVTSDLNLHYLTSLGVQAFAKHSALSTINPALIFDFLVKSDLSNSQYCMPDLMAVSYAQKAALWNLYGRVDLCSLSCQMLLHLDCCTDVTGVLRNSEAECLALCHMACLHADQGLYDTAMDILSSARSRYPPTSQHSHLWMFCSQSINFMRSRLRLRVTEAEEAISGIASVDPLEARYCYGLLLVDQGELSKAIDLSQSLINQLHSTSRVSPHLLVRLLLLKGEALCSSGNATSAVKPLLEALILSRKCFYSHITTLVYMHLAFAQYLIGKFGQALKLISVAMTTMTSHGSLFDRARAEYLYIRCQMALSSPSNSHRRTQVLSSLADHAERVLTLFRSIDARLHEMHILYFQSHLYNALGNTTARNRCAQFYKQISIDLPITRSTALCIL